MGEEAKVCEHTETELKHDVDEGGYYVQCQGCGLQGPAQSQEGAAREGWTQLLRWIRKQKALFVEREKVFATELADAMGLTAGLQGQLDIGKREAGATEREAAALERIVSAFERITTILEESERRVHGTNHRKRRAPKSVKPK